MALRVGAESKPKLYAAIGLGAIVLIIAIVQIPKFFGFSMFTGVGATELGEKMFRPLPV